MSEFTLKAVRKNVMNYAKKMGFFESLEEIDVSTKSEYVIQLAIHGLVQEKEPISLDDAVLGNADLFFDWYLFEREERNRRSIAELYMKSEDFRRDFPGVGLENGKRAARRLKNPLWTHFTVCGKEGKDEYQVKKLEGEETYIVHDVSTSSQVNIGNVILAKLYPFGEKYYVSGFILTYSEEAVAEYEKARAVMHRLDGWFKEFMEKKDVTEKTARKYEEMHFMLSEYVAEKEYTTMKWVKRLNVDTFVKWARKQWGLSRYAEDQCRSAARQFMKFMKEKEKEEETEKKKKGKEKVKREKVKRKVKKRNKKEPKRNKKDTRK